jgi:hypothetical protein
MILPDVRPTNKATNSESNTIFNSRTFFALIRKFKICSGSVLESAGISAINSLANLTLIFFQRKHTLFYNFLLRPLFTSSHLTHIYQGRNPKGDADVVGCLLCFHAPLDGRGADQALVEKRITSFHANSEYLMNKVKCNQEQFRTINHNNVY